MQFFNRYMHMKVKHTHDSVIHFFLYYKKKYKVWVLMKKYAPKKKEKKKQSTEQIKIPMEKCLHKTKNKNKNSLVGGFFLFQPFNVYFVPSFAVCVVFICVRPKRLTKQYPIAICINIYFIIFHIYFFFPSSGLLSV